MNEKKIAMKLEELRDEFDGHIAKSKCSYYFALKPAGSSLALSADIYFGGGVLETEVIALPDSSQPFAVGSVIGIDGKTVCSEEGAITIFSAELAAGCHTVAVEVTSNAIAARLRLSGNIGRCTESI